MLFLKSVYFLVDLCMLLHGGRVLVERSGVLCALYYILAAVQHRLTLLFMLCPIPQRTRHRTPLMPR